MPAPLITGIKILGLQERAPVSQPPPPPQVPATLQTNPLLCFQSSSHAQLMLKLGRTEHTGEFSVFSKEFEKGTKVSVSVWLSVTCY